MLIPLQIQETKQIAETTAKSIEQINNPILQILLIVLLVIIGVLIYAYIRKDKQIQTIHEQLIKTIKDDMETIKELESAFKNNISKGEDILEVAEELKQVLTKIELKIDYALNYKKDA